MPATPPDTQHAAHSPLRLPLALYRLHFIAQEAARLPAHAGSAWRGVFGRALKHLVCVTREPACPTCLLYRSCVYPYLFETPPDPAAGKLRKYPTAPHPYLLRPGLGGAHAAGAMVHVDVVLFGHGNRHLPYVLHAFDQAGRRGIGRSDGRLELSQVAQQTTDGDWHSIHRPGEALRPQPPTIPEPPPCPTRLTLVLETPLRIRQAEKLVGPEAFQFSALFANLLRRISLLTTFHTDTPLEADFAALSRAGGLVRHRAARLRWHEWVRYSSRQDALLQMGGLVGTVDLDGAGLEPFWPYLWLGQWTHAGKGAVMGLGQYRLVMA
ncbi:MAG: CRISPR system precrRNA processing endoribonuclease RAMP protein Cas6 [Candidatus Contendobacter sp.]|nr:CRISPR system precrRNA processing endoribonuclease RAMP protein Cas6 [Candidatus Contendobacter sp.]MDS4060622.1 CRISPR system precrRNA processing endoribonuclease RAMP protein Cas6 [Candidatus Contendobacter sp.]